MSLYFTQLYAKTDNDYNFAMNTAQTAWYLDALSRQVQQNSPSGQIRFINLDISSFDSSICKQIVK
jgi:hypothetical protein